GLNYADKSGYVPAWVSGGWVAQSNADNYSGVWFDGSRVKWVKARYEFFINTSDPVKGVSFLNGSCTAGTKINMKNVPYTYEDIDTYQGVSVNTNTTSKFFYGKPLSSKAPLRTRLGADGFRDFRCSSSVDNKAAITTAGGRNYAFTHVFNGGQYDIYWTGRTADMTFGIDSPGMKLNEPIGSSPGPGMGIYPLNVLSPNSQDFTVTKAVSDADEKDVTKNTLESVNEPYYYTISSPMPYVDLASNFWQSFSFEDQVDTCLNINKVTIYGNNAMGVETDYSSRFNISTTRNLIKAVAKDTKTLSFYQVGVYKIKVDVNIIADMDTLNAHGHITDKKVSIKNMGIVIADTNDGKGENEKESEEVVTEVGLPILSIDKTPKTVTKDIYDSWQYRIMTTQTVKDAIAYNMVIDTGKELPGFEIDYDSIEVIYTDKAGKMQAWKNGKMGEKGVISAGKVYEGNTVISEEGIFENVQHQGGIHSTEPVKIQTTERGFIAYTGIDLEYGHSSGAAVTDPTDSLETIEIVYNTRPVDISLQGKSLDTEANANTKKEDGVEGVHDATKINLPKPVPKIIKSVENKKKYYKVGDTVKYKLDMSVSGAKAFNVMVTDEFQKDGMNIDYTSIKAYLNGKAFSPKKIEKTNRGFVITTGLSMLLTSDKLLVKYSAKIDRKKLLGTKIKNIGIISITGGEDEDEDLIKTYGKLELWLKEGSKDIQTGDMSAIRLFFTLMLISALGYTYYFFQKKKNGL
ncbi:MAG: hypothetical protein ACRCUS_02325, partial [Anaerovoracaceae bacterium]